MNQEIITETQAKSFTPVVLSGARTAYDKLFWVKGFMPSWKLFGFVFILAIVSYIVSNLYFWFTNYLGNSFISSTSNNDDTQ